MPSNLTAKGIVDIDSNTDDDERKKRRGKREKFRDWLAKDNTTCLLPLGCSTMEKGWRWFREKASAAVGFSLRHFYLLHEISLDRWNGTPLWTNMFFRLAELDYLLMTLPIIIFFRFIHHPPHSASKSGCRIMLSSRLVYVQIQHQ